MESEIVENKTQKTNFTQVSNEILNSDKLSWGAKGLWAYMAGKPEGWRFTIRLMASQCKDSLSATTSKLDELMKLGYVKREIVMTKNGKQCFYSIYEEPNFDFPNLEKPNLEKPNLENHILEYSNTNISNKELSNKEISKVDRKRKSRVFEKPSVEEVKEYCEERKNKVDPEAFVDFYESKGWLVGKTPMKDWKAAVRTWERNGYGRQTVKDEKSTLYEPKDGEDVTYQRMFEFWKKYIRVSVVQTTEQVKACKDLLADLGEEGLQRLIVALAMRSKHSFLPAELTKIKDFVGLRQNAVVVQNFYDQHWKYWQQLQKAAQEGKEVWQV